MKYLFDMGEVWHVYSDVGKQWIYQRLERVGEEILEKNGDTLPGPLGRLDLLKQLEGECDGLRKQLDIKEQERKAAAQEVVTLQQELEKEKASAEEKLQQAGEELCQTREQLAQEKNLAMNRQKEEFERAYGELQSMAEELQKEGKMWRQRYLDLAYQVAPGK